MPETMFYYLDRYEGSMWMYLQVKVMVVCAALPCYLAGTAGAASRRKLDGTGSQGG